MASKRPRKTLPLSGFDRDTIPWCVDEASKPFSDTRRISLIRLLSGEYVIAEVRDLSQRLEEGNG